MAPVESIFLKELSSTYGPLEAEHVEQLAALAEPVDFSPGALVFSEGSPAGALFIVIKGSAVVHRAGDILREVVSPEMLALADAMAGGDYLCSAAAGSGGLTVLRVPQQVLADVGSNHPRVAERLLVMGFAQLQRCVSDLIRNHPGPAPGPEIAEDPSGDLLPLRSHLQDALMVALARQAPVTLVLCLLGPQAGGVLPEEDWFSLRDSLRRVLRGRDQVYRVSETSIGILLPGVDPPQSLPIAERVAEALNQVLDSDTPLAMGISSNTTEEPSSAIQMFSEALQGALCSMQQQQPRAR